MKLVVMSVQCTYHMSNKYSVEFPRSEGRVSIKKVTTHFGLFLVIDAGFLACRQRNVTSKVKSCRVVEMLHDVSLVLLDTAQINPRTLYDTISDISVR